MNRAAIGTAFLRATVPLWFAVACADCGVVGATVTPSQHGLSATAFTVTSGTLSDSATATIEPESIIQLLFDTNTNELSFTGAVAFGSPVSFHLSDYLQFDASNIVISLRSDGTPAVTFVDPATGDFAVELPLSFSAIVTWSSLSIPFMQSIDAGMSGHFRYDPSTGYVSLEDLGGALPEMEFKLGSFISLEIDGTVNLNFDNGAGTSNTLVNASAS